VKSAGTALLREGNLDPDHARQLMELAIDGSSLAVDDLGMVEVLLDHSRTYAQATLVHEGIDVIDNPVLVRPGGPVSIQHTKIIGVFLAADDDELGWTPYTVVGLASAQFEYVHLGNRYERLERYVVVTAKDVQAGEQEHPAVQKLRRRIGTLILAS
jgi:hypothetical protein